MFAWLKRLFFGKDTSLLNKLNALKEKPSHLWLMVAGDSRQEVLKKLEKRAGLPPGDLSQQEGHGREMASWPHGIKVKQWTIESITNALWRTANSGYIAGDIGYVESHSGWVGRLHVSRNCPGVFGGDGKCLSCGATSEF